MLFLSIYYDYYGGGGEEEDEGGFQALQGPSSGWLIQLGWYIWMDGWGINNNNKWIERQKLYLEDCTD